MENTPEGNNFLKTHPVDDNPLSIESKKELCKILCGNLLSQQMKLGVKEILILADSIASYYKKEDPKVFFDGKKGILYHTANNMATTLRKKGMISGPINKKRKIESSQLQNRPSVVFRSEEINSDVYVRSNPFVTGDEFDRHWENSTKYRLNTISSLENANIGDIISKYKTYGRFDGYYYVCLL